MTQLTYQWCLHVSALSNRIHVPSSTKSTAKVDGATGRQEPPTVQYVLGAALALAKKRYWKHDQTARVPDAKIPHTQNQHVQPNIIQRILYVFASFFAQSQVPRQSKGSSYYMC